MDLVKKMVEALETEVAAQTNLKKIDFSLGNVTNIRQSYVQGFLVRPTTLEQVEGGVGFLLFRQGFEISLFEKLAFRGDARQKVFELYSELEKLFQKLYTVRVTGDDYQVLNIDNVVATAPQYDDTYASLSINISATYRRTNVFNGG